MAESNGWFKCVMGIVSALIISGIIGGVVLYADASATRREVALQDKRIERLENYMERMDGRLSSIDNRLANIEGAMSAPLVRARELELKVLPD